MFLNKSLAAIAATTPHFAVGNVKGWSYISEPWVKKTAKGEKEIPGGDEMVLVQMTGLDDEGDNQTRYTTMKRANWEFQLACFDDIKAGFAKMDENKAKLAAERQAKGAERAKALKVAGMKPLTIQAALVEELGYNPTEADKLVRRVMAEQTNA